MTDAELFAYYERNKDCQAGVIDMTLNLRDLLRMVHLICPQKISDEKKSQDDCK